jgi:endonuclease/exonuclease/phosphatase family metal-dependent hydrolase
MNIVTWNSQGSPLNKDDKKETLKKLLANNHIVCLQECGDLDLDLDGYNFVGVRQAGAKNFRCSTMIISKTGKYPEITIEIRSNSGRGAVGIKCGDFDLYTIHAESSNCAMQDVKQLLLIAANRRRPYVVCGDFNVAPPVEKSGDLFELRSRSRPYPCSPNVVFGLRGTHTSGKTLDYFYTYGMNVQIRTSISTTSDHVPVEASVGIQRPINPPRDHPIRRVPASGRVLRYARKK